jgi:hypothetical protein
MLDVVKTYVGNVLSGFATPFQMLKDVTAQFILEEAHVRDTSQSPLLGPTLTRIPFAAEGLPVAASPTRARGYERREPLLRQFLGLTVRDTANVAEDELVRLGFRRKDVLPTSGDKEFDEAIAKRMGQGEG